LASSTFVLGRYEEALRYHQQSLEIRREIGDRQRQAWCLYNIGNVFHKLEQHAETLGYYEQARVIFEELGAKANALKCLSGQGVAHLGVNENEQALACSTQAIQMLEGGQTCEGPQEVYFNHFKVLSAHGRDEEAKKYLQKAYDEVMQRAEKIQNSEFRESFLKNVKTNREILEAWQSAKAIDNWQPRPLE